MSVHDAVVHVTDSGTSTGSWPFSKAGFLQTSLHHLTWWEYSIESSFLKTPLRVPPPCPAIAALRPEAISKGFPILPTMVTIARSPWTLS